MTGSGVAKDHIRQIASPSFRVTGGAMYEMDGRTHLVFGQDFSGNYNPNKNGTYTNQVRSFDIVDDGTTLSIANPTSTTPDPNYRRRDLNVFPVIRPAGGGTLDEGLLVLSGVFTPPPVWRVDRAGGNRRQPATPTMDDPHTRPRSNKDSTATIRPSWGCSPRPAAKCTRCCSAASACSISTPQTMQSGNR